MSLNGVEWPGPGESMAKWEIHLRTANVLWNLRWRYWLKSEVIIDWPSGWAPLDDSGELHANSSDPNTWYRWWLEKHVGRQRLTWDWKMQIGSNTHVVGYEHLYNDKLILKFRNPAHATMFALKYAN